ncbi:S-adenosyl-L-methionine-dependent methyltransferase [Mycena polygramma]|nr:S-adenosyl-L-methionine-dependent methyltransferase [Mycena polygramma]
MKFSYSHFSKEDMDKMEEITGFFAKALLTQSGLLPTPPTEALVLDNACGAGVLASVLFNTVGKTSDVRVVCGDLEEGMIEMSTERIKTNGWNAEATVADAQALPFPDNHFTHNLINFGIQNMPDTALVAKEAFRVLKSGGKFGVTSWVAPGWLDSFRIAIDGFATPPMFAKGGTNDALPPALTAAGFTDVEVQTVKFDCTNDMTHYLRYMREVFKMVLVGEVAEKYETYMRGRYGDGDFVLTWEAVVVTAEKK